MSDVMIIEYTESYGKGRFDVHMIAMYNKTNITDEEVNKVINSGCYDPRVIIMTKDQYKTVFNRKLD